MKKEFKISMAIIAITASTIFTACNNSSDDAKSSDMDTAKTEMAHEGGDHIYACPMHPEVTGKEGDTCSKCNMKLEAVKNTDTTKVHADH